MQVLGQWHSENGLFKFADNCLILQARQSLLLDTEM